MEIQAIDQLIEEGKPILLRFKAPWCTKCKTLDPLLEQAKGIHPEVQDVDVDQNPSFAMRYEIKTLPTLVFIKETKEKFRLVNKPYQPIEWKELEALLLREIG